MEKKPFSDSRWRDNPTPKRSACGSCMFYLGFLKCDKHNPKIPMDVLDKSFLGTKEYDTDYCPYRKEK